MTGVTFPTNRRFIVWAFVSVLTMAGLAGVAAGTAAAQTEGGICGRTEQVLDEILDKLPDISDCALVTESDLGSISRLVLWYEDITELQSGDFEGLSNLTYLSLRNNDLSELPADIFSGLSNLEDLDLSDNDLSELPADVFSGLSNLEELRLARNDLSELPADVLSGLSNLEELELSRNDLSELPADIFSGLSNLEELDLSRNDLSELPIDIFNGLDSLKKLYLRVNPGIPFYYGGGELEDHNGITFTPPTPTDGGDTPETATPIIHNSDTSNGGFLSPKDDVDYFTFEIAEADAGWNVIYIEDNYDSSRYGWAYIKYALYDHNLNCVQRHCDLPHVAHYVIVYLEAGTYYLKLSGITRYTYGDQSYGVRVSNRRRHDDYPNYLDRCAAITTRYDDPMYGCQYHLNNTADNPGTPGEDINVEPAWDAGHLGQGVNVLVVDDGMYSEHEDLQDNVREDWNFDRRKFGHLYNPISNHGTFMAGIIAARDNEMGGRGVAPRATIYGINLMAYPNKASVGPEESALHRHRQTAVSSNSWSAPSSPGGDPYLRLKWEDAIKKGVRDGNQGKGTSYICALNKESNYAHYTNFYAVTTACAVNADGKHQAGSGSKTESGSGDSIWVCAPGMIGATAANQDLYNTVSAGP